MAIDRAGALRDRWAGDLLYLYKQNPGLMYMLQDDDEHASITGELIWPRFRYRDAAWAIFLNFKIECIAKTKRSFFDQEKFSKHAPL